MSLLKPTLSKFYLMLFLLSSFMLSLFFWLDHLTPESYNFALLSLSAWLVIAIATQPIFFSLKILACYVIACMLTVLLIPFRKRKRLWELTFSKIILAVSIEFTFWIAGWRF